MKHARDSMSGLRHPLLRLPLLLVMLVTLPGTGLARCACEHGGSMPLRALACSHPAPHAPFAAPQLARRSCCSLRVADAAAAATPSIPRLDRVAAPSIEDAPYAGATVLVIAAGRAPPLGACSTLSPPEPRTPVLRL